MAITVQVFFLIFIYLFFFFFKVKIINLYIINDLCSTKDFNEHYIGIFFSIGEI